MPGWQRLVVGSHSFGEEDLSDDIHMEPRLVKPQPSRLSGGSGRIALPGDIDETIDWTVQDLLRSASPAAARAVLVPRHGVGTSSASSCLDGLEEIPLSPAAERPRARQHVRQSWDAGRSFGQSSHVGFIDPGHGKANSDAGTQGASSAIGGPASSQTWVQDIRNPRKLSAPGDLQLVSLEDDLDIEDVASPSDRSGRRLPLQVAARTDTQRGKLAGGTLTALQPSSESNEPGFLGQTMGFWNRATAAAAPTSMGRSQDDKASWPAVAASSAAPPAAHGSGPLLESSLPSQSPLPSPPDGGPRLIRMRSLSTPASGSPQLQGPRIPGTLSEEEEEASASSCKVTGAAAASTTSPTLWPVTGSADLSRGAQPRLRPPIVGAAAAASSSRRGSPSPFSVTGRQVVTDGWAAPRAAGTGQNPSARR